MATAVRTDVAVERLEVAAYTIPTDEPESDGTLEWDSTTIVVVEAHAGEAVGLGYTYADASAGALVESKLADVVRGCDALAPRRGVAAHGRAAAQRRPAGRRVHGALGGRQRALGPEGAPARPAARRPDRARPGRGADLRLGRVLLLLAPAPRGAARRLGRAGHPAGQDEGVAASPGAIPSACRPRATRSATTPSSTSTRTGRSRGSRRSPGWSGSTPSGA